MKFLVLTQDDQCAPASITAQTSAARSYLATRRHAQRRSLKAGGTKEQHELTWKETVSSTSYVNFHSTEPHLEQPISQPAFSARVQRPKRSPAKSEPEHSSEHSFDHLFASLEDEEDTSQPTSDTLFSEAELDLVPLSPSPSMKAEPPFLHPNKNLSLTKLETRSPDTFLPPSLVPTITCLLDPFVCLSLKITAQEESILHFFLTSGRQWLLGTSENPRCCLALSLARSLMNICPIYVLSHIVIGETVLSKMRNQPVRKHYYQRSAHMYKAINTLLADEKALFSRKLWALIQVAMVENTSRRNDLQAIHLTALDDFVESYGGFAASPSVGTDDPFLEASSRLYAGQLARGVLPVPNFVHFKAVTARFILSLTSVWTWMRVLRANSSRYHNSQSDCGPESFSSLLNYLGNMVHQQQFEDVFNLDTNRGAIFCVLSINLTFVQCPASFDAILDFMSRVQQCLHDTAKILPQSRHELDNLHPAAAAYSISCIRSEVFPQSRNRTEFGISQALADTHKVFHLLSKARQVEITKWLLRCISIVALLKFQGDAAWDSYVEVDSNQLQVLEKELEDAWRIDKKIGKY